MPKRIKLSSKQQNRILKMYGNNKSVKAISAKTGFSESKVRSYLKDAKVYRYRK